MTTKETQTKQPGGKLYGCLVFGPVILVIITLLIATPFWFYDSVSFVVNSVEAQGEVVAIESEADEGTVYYYPVIGFYTTENEAIFFDHSASSTIKGSYEVGEKVSVIYDPTDPEYAKMDTFFGKWLEPSLATLFFVMMLFFSYALWRVWREPQRD